MKKLILFCIFSLGILGLNAQSITPVSGTKDEALQLKEASFNFGKIPQGRPVTHVFEILNSGKQPLVLENVQASCGCTTPEWNAEPIAPGGSGKITVGYNAATAGEFEKTISVFYNKGQMKMITIKGDVWRTPDQSAPGNNSIAILKNQNRY